MASSCCFSELEKTSQATGSGKPASYPTLTVKGSGSHQHLPLGSCALVSSMAQRRRMSDSLDATVVTRGQGTERERGVPSTRSRRRRED